MNEPRKLLVSGDWHGYEGAAKGAARAAVRKGCQVIVQVGDFGFWPHTAPEYVEYVSRKMVKHNLDLVWIDGNHENFDVLYGTEWPRTREGFWVIADRVLYAPRAHRWQWGDVRFLSLGGGYSIDKEWRLANGPVGLYWWPQETITQREVYDCLNGDGPVDVMFTHDMPEGTKLGVPLTHSSSGDEQNRMAVRTVVDGLRPWVLYHGHYHHRQDSLLFIETDDPHATHSVQIVSLADWRGVPLESTWTVLDLSEFKKEAS